MPVDVTENYNFSNNHKQTASNNGRSCVTTSNRRRNQARHGSSSSQTSGSSDSDSSSSSDSSDFSLPPPPDGGWGWVVVIASFTVHLIADGCAFSFGVLYSELLEYFGKSKGKTAWIGSLFVSVPLITGPIASALTNKYGCRKVTIAGSLIASAGFVASSFSNSVEMLCFTFGIVSGFGLSMVYVAGVVIVAFYFEKMRAFATGIAVAGSGIGTFLFAPLIEQLIQYYTWRGAVLILGGIMLQMAVCGALFRPLLPPHIEKERRRRRRLSGISSKMSSQSTDETRHSSGHSSGYPVPFPTGCHYRSVETEPMTVSLVQFPTYLQKDMDIITPDLLADLKQNGRTLHEFLAENNLLEKFYAMQSLSDVPKMCSSSTNVTDSNVNDKNADLHESTKDLPSPAQDQDVSADPFGEVESNGKPSTLPKHNSLSRKMKHKHCPETEVWIRDTSKARVRKAQVADQFQPMYRKDIFYRGNLLNTCSTFPGRSASCPNIVILSAGQESNSSSRTRLHVLSLLQLSKEVKLIMRRMLDFSIFRSVVFNYFCLSSMLLYLAYDVPYVYTVDKSITELGINIKQASFLVSIIGITSTVGQIVIGYIGDRPRIKSLHLYNALTSIAGICTMLVPLFKTYPWMAAYCGAYGFFISGNYALCTIILVELLGMDKLTNAYGIVMLAEGIANVVGPPLAGWLADQTGEYDSIFVVAGVLMLISGVMLFAIPCLEKNQKSRNPDDSSSTDSEDDPSSTTQPESGENEILTSKDFKGPDEAFV